jgi:hypothetical protein
VGVMDIGDPAAGGGQRRERGSGLKRDGAGDGTSANP